MKLSPLDATRGGLVDGHVDSDDMEGQLKWNPLAPEMSWHRQQRLDHAQVRHIAIIEEAAELVRVEAAQATREASVVSLLEVVLKMNLFKYFSDVIMPCATISTENCSASAGVILIATHAFATAGRGARVDG